VVGLSIGAGEYGFDTSSSYKHNVLYYYHHSKLTCTIGGVSAMNLYFSPSSSSSSSPARLEQEEEVEQEEEDLAYERERERNDGSDGDDDTTGRKGFDCGLAGAEGGAGG